ncbi:MAG TPA: MFS transporter [Roseiflexaceae bacterium]|nr:MFS transporter [Roseiflexaceae bacterium]
MRLKGLWRHADFLKFWFGQTVSVFGSAITGLALPLVAAIALNATPAQMGLLGAAATAPFLLVGLFVGVWVDRKRRRPILIATDIGRALLLLIIPLAAWLGALRIELLYLVEFLVGVMTVFFEVAYQSYLPSLVTREELVEGNSKLEVSRSAGQIAGPGLAGLLIELITAPIAIIVDAVSFLLSGVALALIRRPEPEPEQPAERNSIWKDIGEGLSWVGKHPLLRPIICCTATTNLCTGMWGAVLTLFMIDQLKLSAGMMGLIMSIGAPGTMVGALVAAKVAQRIGLGPAIVGSALLGGLSGLLIPLAGIFPAAGVPLLIGSQFFMGMAFVVYNINQISLRQTITPDRLMGRMNASIRFVVWGILPIGALLGGALGTLLGIFPTLVISSLGLLLAFLWVQFSPVRALREQPTPVEDAPVAAPALG